MIIIILIIILFKINLNKKLLLIMSLFPLQNSFMSAFLLSYFLTFFKWFKKIFFTFEKLRNPPKTPLRPNLDFSPTKPRV
jgi:hypothetical protein